MVFSAEFFGARLVAVVVAEGESAVVGSPADEQPDSDTAMQMVTPAIRAPGMKSARERNIVATPTSVSRTLALSPPAGSAYEPIQTLKPNSTRSHFALTRSDLMRPHLSAADKALASGRIRPSIGTLAKCDPFGIPSTSHWMGAAIIV